jgi:ABC-type uncharacterized transport system permease subunit
VRTCTFHSQLAALVFYILCETINKNQFVLNFVVCIVLLAMDFWTVRRVVASVARGLTRGLAAAGLRHCRCAGSHTAAFSLCYSAHR